MRPDTPPVLPGNRCSSLAVTEKRLGAVRALVGKTPLLAIHTLVDGEPLCIYAKLESLNLTGSIKDRMALRILADAYAQQQIWPGDVIVEATSGNTGISFAAIGRALGHSVRIFMPDWMSRERVALIESLGATIVPVSAEQGGFMGSIAMARDFAGDGVGVFHPRQFESHANVAAHRDTTGPEILRQMLRMGARPTAFVAGVGTGGTVMGAGAFLRAELGDVTVHPLEPASSPTLRTGHKVGKHRIQGISDEFVPSIVDLDALDDIVDVEDGDAILMAQKLAGSLGLAVGISSGANFLGAVKVALAQGRNAAVATVFCDSNKKYLTTDLCNQEPVRDDYLTPRVQPLSMQAIPDLG